MLRLTTIGPPLRPARVAIIGYYEDGPNLVTLAMNGWAATEPAWWLNLQAHPDTTVDLADGPRPCVLVPRWVRARAALGLLPRLPRLGRRPRGLAARRQTESATVVLEPRAAAVATPAALTVIGQRCEKHAASFDRAKGDPSCRKQQ